jgi:hypothetical protein
MKHISADTNLLLSVLLMVHNTLPYNDVCLASFHKFSVLCNLEL